MAKTQANDPPVFDIMHALPFEDVPDLKIFVSMLSRRPLRTFIIYLVNFKKQIFLSASDTGICSWCIHV